VNGFSSERRSSFGVDGVESRWLHAQEGRRFLSAARGGGRFDVMRDRAPSRWQRWNDIFHSLTGKRPIYSPRGMIE
jgi:hypothetical protein